MQYMKLQQAVKLAPRQVCDWMAHSLTEVGEVVTLTAGQWTAGIEMGAIVMIREDGAGGSGGMPTGAGDNRVAELLSEMSAMAAPVGAAAVGRTCKGWMCQPQVWRLAKTVGA